MRSAKHQHERVPTGISGLDVILNGGLLPGSIYLVEGVPGAGKTTLALQFIYEGITRYGEPGLIVSFEEFPEQLERDAAMFGWDLRKLQNDGKLAMISTSPSSIMKMLEEPGGVIDQLAAAGKLKRVMVDSITHFQLATENQAELRRMVSAFLNGLRRLKATTLLTKEIERDDPTSIPFEEYLVDGVIRLSNLLMGPLRRTRCLEVIKSRGQPHLSGKSGFRFGREGVEVFPRLSSNFAADEHWLPETEGALREERGASSSTTCGDADGSGNGKSASIKEILEDADYERISSGIPGVDQMFQNGLIRGSSTLVAGTSGTGKTLLCLQFLKAGLVAGHPAVMQTVEENASKLIHFARSIGVDLGPYIKSGQLVLQSCSPAETTYGEALWRLYRLVRQHNATRVVIDSLNALFGDEQQQHPGVLETAVQHLIDIFEAMRITAMFTWEIQDITGDLRISDHGLSAVVDSIVLLRYVEVAGEMRRMIGIIKSRGTSHDNQLREFHITSEGFRVEARMEGLTGLLRGSARGVPTEAIDELIQPLLYIQDMAGMLRRGEVPASELRNAFVGMEQEAERVSTSLRERLGPRTEEGDRQ